MVSNFRGAASTQAPMCLDVHTAVVAIGIQCRSRRWAH